MSTPRRGFPLTSLMVGVLVVGGLAGMLGRAVQQAREAARESQCFCIKAIAIALHNYHDVHGSFPPAYVADSTGRPVHSWRVLLLPFLEEGTLYNAYNMAEPWDGPNNRKLLDRRPSVYHCPSRDDDPSTTSYLAVTGPGTAFPGAGSTKLAEIVDGTSRTVLIAEVSNVEVAWTAPVDLDVRSMSWTIDDPSKPGFSSPHARGPLFLFADATLRRLGRSTPTSTLKALTTIKGGEAFDRAQSW